MRASQYVKLEKQIAAADTSTIRERWLWGLRVLRDPAKTTAASLKNRATQELIDIAAGAGIVLHQREIQRRLQCARTYKSEAELRHAMSQFKTWFDLVQAGFPAYETDEDEPPADHRTEDERLHDAKSAADDALGPQPALDGLEMWKLNPFTATLKDAFDECDKSEDMTANFAKYDRKRRSFANRLLDAAGGDASVRLAEAAAKLPPF